MVFPRIPLIRVEGPLAVAQLVETSLLNLVNYPSLIATNASRMRFAAENAPRPRLGNGVYSPKLLEFGLRRAQGPDGGLSASKYSFIGGFHGTSNVLAGKLESVPVSGTCAHSFITSFYGMDGYCDSQKIVISCADGTKIDFLPIVMKHRSWVHEHFGTLGNYGELFAFASYASSFPEKFIALVDTYETISSGVPNFLVVGLSLLEIGYRPIGIRLDSGDLAYLSKESRKMFFKIDKIRGSNDFSPCTIIASNDLNEDVIVSLNSQGHEIDVFAVGTNLVTCQKQPALGCVYKLVEVNGQPRIKLSQDSDKIVIPSKKVAYRLFGSLGQPILDVLMLEDEAPPLPNERLYCRHPFSETRRAVVVPTKVEPLLTLVWNGFNFGNAGENRSSTSHEDQITYTTTLQESQDRCRQSLSTFREDHLRLTNPTPYKISVSSTLYDYLHNLILKETPISEIF